MGGCENVTDIGKMFSMLLQIQTNLEKFGNELAEVKLSLKSEKTDQGIATQLVGNKPAARKNNNVLSKDGFRAFRENNTDIKEKTMTFEDESGSIGETVFSKTKPAKCLSEEQGITDNNLNEWKVDTDKMSKRDTVPYKTGVSKSSSFQTQQAEKPVINKRASLSDPITKEERLKHEQFRRSCLSEAIKWHQVDIIESCPEIEVTDLPEWVCKKERKRIFGKNIRKKNRLRKFLTHLLNQNFERMRDWLASSVMEEDIKRRIWETYDEFSDYETNKNTLRCFMCRLMNTVCVTQITDHLYSAGLLSTYLYRKVIDTENTIGSQEEEWASIIQECRNKDRTLNNFKTTLTVACMDQAEKRRGNEKSDCETILTEMDKYQGEAAELYSCSCERICSRSLHPVSCVKSLSLAEVYMSSPKQYISFRDQDSDMSSESLTETDSPVVDSSSSKDYSSSDGEYSDGEIKYTMRHNKSKGNVDKGQGYGAAPLFCEKSHLERRIRREESENRIIKHQRSQQKHRDFDPNLVPPLQVYKHSTRTQPVTVVDARVAYINNTVTQVRNHHNSEDGSITSSSSNSSIEILV